MGGVKGLPYDAEIEYLESETGVWLDTGIVPDFDTTVEIKGILYSSGAYLAAARTGSSNANAYYVLMSRDATYCRWILGSNTGSLYSGLYNKEITILFNEYQTHKVYIDGVEKQTFPSGNVVDTQTTLALFAANGLGTNHYTGKVQINYCKIYKSGVLVRDFIPVRKGTTGYMYDRVSSNLFANAGTGDFVLGNDIVEIDYLESSGTQVINTGIPVKDIGKYVTCCQFENASKAKAEGSTETNKYYFIGKNAQNKYYAALNSNVVTSTITNDGAWHEFELDAIQGLFSIDGSIVNTLSAGYVNSNIKFALFACNGVSAMEGNYSYHISGKKKWTKIYDLNGELILDLIPVRVGQVGYMRDKISGQLFGNAGTGSFTLGSDKIGGGVNP